MNLQLIFWVRYFSNFRHVLGWALCPLPPFLGLRIKYISFWSQNWVLFSIYSYSISLTITFCQKRYLLNIFHFSCFTPSFSYWWASFGYLRLSTTLSKATMGTSCVPHSSITSYGSLIVSTLSGAASSSSYLSARPPSWRRWCLPTAYLLKPSSPGC